MDANILQHFIEVSNYWNTLCLDDTTIGVSDTGKFLAYFLAKHLV